MSVLKNKYRSDINGLRALAVVAVVLFHFGIPGFGGGFVGVDVFFVISGFLMTQIIFSSLVDENFSIVDFYISRAKRIIPALLVVCVFVFVFGWFFLLDNQYKILASDVVFSILFLSNVKFWKSAGYFDTSSHDKFLLHTWSLSVEWQFYIFLPLVLLFLWKFFNKKTYIFCFYVFCTIVSLCLSVYLTNKSPNFAFYLLPTRAWEMFAGGLVFLLSNKIKINSCHSKFLEISGISLILISILAFNDKTPWPGAYALLPVLGTIFVLIANSNQSKWSEFFIVKFIGKSSYSIYLWHWPIFVILIYFDLNKSIPAIALGLVLSFFIGYLSYVFIEGNYRKSFSSINIKTLFVFSLFLILLFFSFGVKFLDVGSNRFPENVRKLESGILDRNPRYEECYKSDKAAECKYGGDLLGAIVLGDSHASSVVRTVENALDSKNEHVLDWSLVSCPTISKFKAINGYEVCDKFMAYVNNKIKSFDSQVPLIIVNRLPFYVFGNHNPIAEPNGKYFRYYFDDSPVLFNTNDKNYLKRFKDSYIDAVCEFSKERKVFLVRPIPEMPFDVPLKSAQEYLKGSRKNVSITLDEYHARNEEMWDAQNEASEKCGVKILDPLPFLCWEGRCHGVKNGTALYYDDDHLNESGSRLLLPIFKEIFED